MEQENNNKHLCSKYKLRDSSTQGMPANTGQIVCKTVSHYTGKRIADSDNYSLNTQLEDTKLASHSRALRLFLKTCSLALKEKHPS